MYTSLFYDLNHPPLYYYFWGLAAVSFSCISNYFGQLF